MNTANVCTFCSAQLPAGQKYCSACGSFLERETGAINIECETHSDRRAIGFCVICSKPVCNECEVKSAGKILCQDPDHGIILQEWRLICMPDSEFEAEAFARNLGDSGIIAKTFSLHDHVTARWLSDNRVLIFVKKGEKEKARALLKELNLIDHEEQNMVRNVLPEVYLNQSLRKNAKI
jgi:hypothetical protein